MQHNLSSPLEDRWFISYTVLSDLLGSSLTPITSFFKERNHFSAQIDEHHKALGIDNNTHNRTYHPHQSITQFLHLHPD